MKPRVIHPPAGGETWFEEGCASLREMSGFTGVRTAECSLVKLSDSLYFACVESDTLSPAGLRVSNVRSPSFGAPATSTTPPKPILFLEK